jgi:hypothetical protein
VSSSPACIRSAALDALRGLAILGMALSGLIPFGVQADGSLLPAWMYHAQLPPPAHKFDAALPGLTWVDLVFPFFLFALGAAIPLALAQRVAAGVSSLRLAGHGMQRGLLLTFFALYVEQVRPHVMSKSPTSATYLLALLAFALLFPVFMRLPEALTGGARTAIRMVGWGACIGLLLALHWTDVTANQWEWLKKRDIIIAVLANMAFAGTVVWLLTRENVPARLLILLAMLALRLAKSHDGWVKQLWDGDFVDPALRVYVMSYAQVYFLQYLCIVIPGTIAGDVLSRWLRAPAPLSSREEAGGGSQTPLSRREGAGGGSEPYTARERVRQIALATICVTLTIGLCITLQARWLAASLAGAAACSAAATIIARRLRGEHRGVLRALLNWGLAWLALGLILEPYEGGIKKDHATISYYFVTSAQAIFTLLFLIIVIDLWRVRVPFALLIGSGQNPMIAYAGIHNLLRPVLQLTQLEALLLLLKPAWLGVVRGLIKTTLLAAAASVFTRLRIYWRT